METTTITPKTLVHGWWLRGTSESVQEWEQRPAMIESDNRHHRNATRNSGRTTQKRGGSGRSREKSWS